MVKLLKDLFKSTATHPDHATKTILERLVDRVCEGRPDINSQTRSCRLLCIVRPDGYLPSSNPLSPVQMIVAHTSLLAVWIGDKQL